MSSQMYPWLHLAECLGKIGVLAVLAWYMIFSMQKDSHRKLVIDLSLGPWGLKALAVPGCISSGALNLLACADVSVLCPVQWAHSKSCLRMCLPPDGLSNLVCWSLFKGLLAWRPRRAAGLLKIWDDLGWVATGNLCISLESKGFWGKWLEDRSGGMLLAGVRVFPLTGSVADLGDLILELQLWV